MPSRRPKTSPSTRRAVSAHRERLKRGGQARVELRLHQDDAPLIRRVAEALNDPAKAAATRKALHEALGEKPPMDFKEFLISGPSFDDLDLERPLDYGRDIEW